MPRPFGSRKMIIQFHRTFDLELVRSILAVDPTYGAITEEASPAREDFQVQYHPSVMWVLACVDGQLFACYSFLPENSACLGIHWCCAPGARRIRSVVPQVTQALFKWIWECTDCCRIVAKIPVFNTLALQLAEKSQMLVFGRNVKSFPKHGRLWDEVLLGISRPGVT